jgi:hypothetical protein
MIAGFLQGAQTVHHGHTPLLEILSDTEASGIWAMNAIVTMPDQSVQVHGHYYDTFRKIDGKWKFSTIHLTRIRVVTTQG